MQQNLSRVTAAKRVRFLVLLFDCELLSCMPLLARAEVSVTARSAWLLVFHPARATREVTNHSGVVTKNEALVLPSFMFR